MGRSRTADVCLVVEGTYPYVRGGVSSWVHNLIRGLPGKTFRVLFIGPSPDIEYEERYELPENLLGVDKIYAQDFRPEKMRSPAPSRDGRGRAWELLRRFHERLPLGPGVPLFDELYAAVGSPESRSLGVQDLFGSPESWEMVLDLYRRNRRDASFVDYYWTWRFTHLPLFQMLQAEVPPARVYHTVSTGYAGFLAALAKKRTGSPMIVTEHGIYTRERSIEIAQADWIHVTEQQDYKIRRTQSFFKQWWTDMFRMMSRLCYQEADRVITITQANQRYQLEEGADPQRMLVIPNGIRPERFRAAREAPRPEGEFNVGFVGRVVPIKDVKTLIRAVKLAEPEIPNLRAYVIGPTEEDPEYFAECRQLTSLLGLEDRIVYTGPQDVLEYYRRMHVLVLTSISEGQPLVILEANSAGVPVVATNVGACAELLHGRTPEDRALGPGGIVTAVSSPRETADALIRLARDGRLRERMSRAGAARMERFYREDELNRTYQRIYDALAGEG
ncbi:glycosyl transferase, group 1 [Rubrobacter xylanophilus DSM 9941]|uniref:Glycosyl transferase, group 1 n=1 Tax=Rubrobacter xylanophilus (strain DSM 9941 / JCM 11954 / NBRC 16129 / PRD-1) TaxID=266117 RepID=Q1ASP3_RUBXD|nr:GT4 family glycosyltransferase PelF [Rubrobacter xylanophilus]ABG05585.1 glycosyl transferase, group 1 [Rubrobacter xylanophilus DSM 9941]